MSFLSKVLGVMGSFFQIGGVAGPGINANAGALEARNAANNAFAVMRGALPVGDNDLTTKQYVDGIFKPIPCSLQWNGNVALPLNSATERYYVVTTSGSYATIGEVLWDDGLNTGSSVVVLPAVIGNQIFTTTTFSGGAITLLGNLNYGWTGSAWSAISPPVAGAEFCIRIALTTAATQSSVSSVPMNAVVTNCTLDVRIAFSPGTTITVGQAGTPALLMDTGDNLATAMNVYNAPQATDWGAAALPVLITVAGSPAAGGGYCLVMYSTPNN